MTFFQGIIAGGTVVHLHREDRTLSFDSTIFQANHLLLLVGMVIKESLVVVPYFSSVARTVFLLTPVLLTVNLGLEKKSITPLQTRAADAFSHISTLASAVAAVALLVLGKYSFAIPLLSLHVIHHLTNEENPLIFLITTLAAILAFVGYGARIMSSDSLLNKIAMIATTCLVLVKIIKDLPPSETRSQSSFTPSTSPSTSPSFAP